MNELRMNEETKQCKKCKEIKPKSNFYKTGGKTCILCRRESQKEYRKKQKQKTHEDITDKPNIENVTNLISVVQNEIETIQKEDLDKIKNKIKSLEKLLEKIKLTE